MGEAMKMRPMARTLVASAARTTTDNSGDLLNTTGSLALFPASIRLSLNVTASSGTSETLDVTLQHSPDGGTTWLTVGAFTQVDGTGTWEAVFRNYAHGADAAYEAAAPSAGAFTNGPMAPSHRIAWTIGGSSPSFTFSVMAVCTPAF